MFTGAVTAWAGSQTLPTISTDDAKVYYAIKNVRQNKFVYWSADNANLKQNSTNNIYGVFYFTEGTATASSDDVVVAKIHNLATENLMAALSSFTAEGVDWYFKANSNGGKVGISIASSETFDASTRNAWNDYNGSTVGSYWANDGGSIFEVVQLTETEVNALAKSTFSLETYKSASGSAPFQHSSSDFNTFETAYNENMPESGVPSVNNIRALESADAAFKATSVNELTDGTKAILGNQLHTTYYANVNSSLKLAAGTDKDSYGYIFTFKKSGEGWKIYNEYYDKYVGSVPSSPNTMFELTADETSATVYTISAAGLCYASINDPSVDYKFWSQTGCNAMHVSTDVKGVVGWTTTADASHFKFITDETEIAAVESAAAKALIAKAEAINFGTKIGTYISNETFTSAKSTLSSEANIANYKALEAAISALDKNAPDATKYYTIKNEGNTSAYLTEDYTTQANSTNKLGQTKGVNIVPSLWKFEAVATDGKTDLFYIVAANSGSCISKATFGYTQHLVEKTSDVVGMYDLFNTTCKASNAEGVTLTHYADDARSDRGTMWVNGDNIQSWNDVKDDHSNTWLIEEVTEIPVTIGSTGYATLNLPFAVTIPNGVKAYKGTKGDGEIALTEVSGVLAANQPVILVGSASTTYQFPIAESNSTTATASGLSGTLVPVTVESDATAYILKNGDNGIGMYKITSDTDRTIPANKAYVAVNDGAANVLVFNFGEATGIRNAAAAADGKANTYYDLNGRQVLYPAHGVFVKANGQKVYIK